MASANFPTFDFDAVILHSEDDFENVVKFCETLKKELDLSRPLRIIPFEEFGSPAKTEIANWDSAVTAARFIFVSEHHYYTDRYGNFFSDVAILEKIPDKLVKVSTGQIADATPCMNAFTGIQLTENWGVTNHALRRLESLFMGDSDILYESPKDASGHTMVDNAGLSELFLPGQYNQQELPSETNLVVANPSLPSTRDSFGASMVNDDETEPKAIYPKTGPSLPAPAAERVHPYARRDPINGQSSALPDDDLEEDSGELVASNTNTTNEPGQAHEDVFTAEGPAVSHHRSEPDGNPQALQPPSTERDRPVPGRSGNNLGPISGGRLEGIGSEENTGAPRGLEDRVVLGAENSLAPRSREGRRVAGNGENRPVPSAEEGGATGGSLAAGLTQKGRDSSEERSGEAGFPDYGYVAVGLAIVLGMILAVYVKNK